MILTFCFLFFTDSFWQSNVIISTQTETASVNCSQKIRNIHRRKCCCWSSLKDNCVKAIQPSLANAVNSATKTMTSFCCTAEARSRFYSVRRHKVFFPPAWLCSPSILLRKTLPAKRCRTSPVHGYEGSAVPISCAALSLSLRVYFSLSFPSSSSHHLPRHRRCRTQPPSPSLCRHQRAVQPEMCARVNHHLFRIKRSPAGLTIRVCDDWRHTEHLHGWRRQNMKWEVQKENSFM